MNENIENIENPIKIESKGTRDLILQELRIRKENTKLKKDNQILSDELAYFMQRTADLEERCSELAQENQTLKSENVDLAFSRNSLGVTMTPEELAIDAAENCYIPYTAEDY